MEVEVQRRAMSREKKREINGAASRKEPPKQGGRISHRHRHARHPLCPREITQTFSRQPRENKKIDYNAESTPGGTAVADCVSG